MTRFYPDAGAEDQLSTHVIDQLVVVASAVVDIEVT